MRLPFILLALAALCYARTGSYIFLAPVKIQKRRVTIGKSETFTNCPGYDNQPSFTPHARA